MSTGHTRHVGVKNQPCVREFCKDPVCPRNMKYPERAGRRPGQVTEEKDLTLLVTRNYCWAYLGRVKLAPFVADHATGWMQRDRAEAGAPTREATTWVYN